MVLCSADVVLQRLAITDTIVPVIFHEMPDSYYQLLMRATSERTVLALNDLLDKAPDVAALSDKQFKELMPASDGDDLSEEEGSDSDTLQRIVAAVPMPAGPERRDIERMHRTAMSVMKGNPASYVDIRSRYSIDLEGRQIHALFDNATHASGRQRGFIGCPNKGHHACFKYTQVHHHENHQAAAAWLVAWSEHARTQPADWPKADHLKYRPPEAEWRALLPGIAELPL